MQALWPVTGEPRRFIITHLLEPSLSTHRQLLMRPCIPWATSFFLPLGDCVHCVPSDRYFTSLHLYSPQIMCGNLFRQSGHRRPNGRNNHRAHFAICRRPLIGQRPSKRLGVDRNAPNYCMLKGTKMQKADFTKSLRSLAQF